MFRANSSVSVKLLLSAVFYGAAFAGCSGRAASPEKKPPLPSVTSPSPHPEHAARAPARELPFSIYSNPDYRVSFHYPRNFALAEESPEEIGGARSQQELAAEEPGAVLVATIVVPDDAYPNTTFAGGSLQLAVNRYQTARGCQDSLLARLGDATGTRGTATVQGVAFAWTDHDEGDAGTEFFERDYAGFANETCYEFFSRVGVAAGTGSEFENAPRAANEKKILGYLEKIISSLEIDPKPASVLDGPPSAQAIHRE